MADVRGLTPGVLSEDNSKLWLDYSGGPQILIEDGKIIRLDSNRSSDRALARTLLTGPAWGCLLQQRGLLPLHASTVVTPDGAVSFAGDCGAGKSTLLSAFIKNGFSYLADDISLVTWDKPGSQASIRPGFPRVKLWPDSRKMLSVNSRFVKEPVSDEVDKHKVDYGIGFETKPRPLEAVFFLEWGNGFETELFTKPAAAAAVTHATYRESALQDREQKRRLFADSVRLAQEIPMFRFSRPDNNHGVHDSVSFLRDTHPEIFG